MIPYDFWMQQESSIRSPFSHDRLSQWFQSPMFEHRVARNPMTTPSSSSSSSSSIPFAGGRRNLMSSGRQIFQSPLAIWFDRFVRDDQSGGGLWEVEHLSDSATHRRNRKVVHWWVDPTRLSNLMSQQHQQQMQQQQQQQQQRYRGDNGIEEEVEEEEEGPSVPNVRVFRQSRPGMAFPSKQAMENRAWQLLREYLQEAHNEEEEEVAEEETVEDRPTFPLDGENGQDGQDEDDNEEEEATEQFMRILGQFVYAGSQDQLSQLSRNQQQQQQQRQRRETTEVGPRAPEAVRDLLRERRDIVGYCVEGTLSPQGDSSQWKVVLINL